MNANGAKDAGEPGLPGWTIFVDANANGALDAGEVSAVTDAAGAYSLAGLPSGTYVVREVQQPGWVQTTANPAPIVLVGGLPVSGIDFGNVHPAPVVTGLSPAQVLAGSGAFTLTVTGTGFLDGATVLWNGSPRATTVASATVVTALVGAADVASAGTAAVAVRNPAPTTGSSGAQTFSVMNAAPILTSLGPWQRKAGRGAFTLTVNGSGFVAGATVYWNGSARPTTFVDATRLMAAILPLDTAVPGSKSVTARNPDPSLGPSNTLVFVVRGKHPGRDFNNDGQSDILWENTAGWVAAWLMSGTAQLDNLLLYNYPVAVDGWHIVGSGDFNGDGQSDLLWQSETGYVAAWIMNGTTQVFNQLLYDYPVAVGGWRIAAAGDLDGDDITDILWQDANGYVAYWLMGVQANGLVYQRMNALLDQRPVAAGGWLIAGTGDLDGDGETDVVWQSPEGYVAAWLMNGVTQRANMLLYQFAVATDGWTVVGTADMNGDGLVDILWQQVPLGPDDTTRGYVATWFMNGVTHAGTTLLTPSRVPDPSWRIVGPK